jgi:hypothetical protein
MAPISSFASIFSSTSGLSVISRGNQIYIGLYAGDMIVAYDKKFHHLSLK